MTRTDDQLATALNLLAAQEVRFRVVLDRFADWEDAETDSIEETAAEHAMQDRLRSLRSEREQWRLLAPPPALRVSVGGPDVLRYACDRCGLDFLLKLPTAAPAFCAASSAIIAAHGCIGGPPAATPALAVVPKSEGAGDG